MFPLDVLHDNRRALKKAMRGLTRERMNMDKQEKKIVTNIKKMAKEGQMDAIKIMAKDLVRTRRYSKKFLLMNAKIRAVHLNILTLKSQDAVANEMKGITKAIQNMNRQLNLPQIQKILHDLEKQAEIMDMREVSVPYDEETDAMVNELIHEIEMKEMEEEEMVYDPNDDAMEDEGDEEETDAVINQVLDELGLQLDEQLGDLSVAAGNLATPDDSKTTSAAVAAALREAYATADEPVLEFDGSKIIANIIINNTLPVSAVLDTEATCCCISEELVEDLDLTEEVQCADGVVSMINTMQRSEGVLKTTIAFGAVTIEIEFVVLTRMLDVAILGVDFLAKTNAVFGCGGHTVHLSPRSLPPPPPHPNHIAPSEITNTAQLAKDVTSGLTTEESEDVSHSLGAKPAKSEPMQELSTIADQTIHQEVPNKRPRSFEQISEGQPAAVQREADTAADEPVLEFDGSKINAHIIINSTLPVSAVLDTGATRSFISEELVEDLDLTAEVKPERLVVPMFTGLEQSEGVLHATIAFGAVTVEIEFIVLARMFDVAILGIDFLAKTNAVFTCGGHTVYLSPRSLTPPPPHPNHVAPSEIRNTAQVAKDVTSGLTTEESEDVSHSLGAKPAKSEPFQDLSTIAEQNIHQEVPNKRSKSSEQISEGQPAAEQREKPIILNTAGSPVPSGR